jgi:hypothetical protein
MAPQTVSQVPDRTDTVLVQRFALEDVKDTGHPKNHGGPDITLPKLW